MIRIVILAIALLHLGCQTTKSIQFELDEAKFSELRKKRQLYLSLIKKHQDKDGFILSDHCDSVLFTALAGIGGMELKSILAARNDKGQWYRRPSKDCLAKGQSKSTISRDMLLGVIYYSVFQGERELLNDLVKFGRSNLWIMGQSDGSLDGTSRVVLTSALRSTLAYSVSKLGGPKYSSLMANPAIFGKGLDGFRAHLQILHILLRGKLLKRLSSTSIDRIKEHFKRNPDNTLFRFAHAKWVDGDYDSVLKALMDEKYFPNTRLPTTADRCTGWIFERDEDDYIPCPERNKEHTGGDFLFLSEILLDQ